MYYTVTKHNWHLGKRRKCRKHKPQASVFYIFQVFLNVRSVLSQSNTQLRLLHLLYYIVVKCGEKHLYSDKTWVFDQSERMYGPIDFIHYSHVLVN